MEKTKVAIIGSGNIGTDLMMKLGRSPSLELVMVAGIDPNSEGLAMAKARGVGVTHEGIEGFLREPHGAKIVFDATSAKAHMRHAPMLEEAGMVAVDLTPAAVGPYVCPVVRMGEMRDLKNVNLITCGGQATIPIIHAIHRVTPVAYAEIVATISSRSAGPGTRQNIDEFTVTTARGLELIGGAKKAKAIIILNPAEPPILMKDTVYALIEPDADERAVDQSIREMVEEVSHYVPGYRLRANPLFEDGKVTVFLEVEGAGDYLPPYAGNLDIMTSAAVRVGEALAEQHQYI